MSSSALQVARTGLDAQAERMRIIANNLANVNTTAFQRDRAEFATLAYQTITAAGARSAGDNQYATGLNLGTGVRLTGTGRITSHLVGLFYRVTRLMADYDLDLVYVFDGQPPRLKRAELDHRRATRARFQQAAAAARAAGDTARAYATSTMSARLTRSSWPTI